MTGFNSKRAAAADKAQEPWNQDEWRKNNWRCQHGWLRGEQCEICNAAQPAQEPVAWPCLIAEADFSQDTVTLTMQCDDYKVSAHKHWLSTTPPQREWVGLTDAEIHGTPGYNETREMYLFALTLIAKLQEKNT